MTTLVIHPDDPTTDFLSVIYADKDWTVIRHNVSKTDLKIAINAHDRIIMLGHGNNYGMFGFGRFVIDSRWVYLLRHKAVVCIWCNADLFVRKYALKGLYTGMIVSDYMEANLYCVQDKGTDIDDSNKLFAKAMSSAVDGASLNDVLSIYNDPDNYVINFNRQNIYYNG